MRDAQRICPPSPHVTADRGGRHAAALRRLGALGVCLALVASGTAASPQIRPADGQPRLPAPLERAALQALTDRLAAGTYPVEAVFAPPPPGITLLVKPERRGVAVLLEVPEQSPRWLLPSAFFLGTRRVEWHAPGHARCPVRVLRRDNDLGLTELAAPGESGCAPPSERKPLPLRDPGSLRVTVRSPGDTLSSPLAETFLPPLPGVPTPLASPVSLRGPAGGAEAFYLLHGAPSALSAPIVDRHAAVVALTCGASWTSPGAGVAIGGHALREFVVGRRFEGHRPRPLPTWRPSWPPPTR